MTSKSKPRKSKKFFTPEEANQMLPLVRAIVKDIVEFGKGLEDREARLSRLRKDGVAMGIITRPQLEEEESAHEREVERLQECVSELAQLGIELKDVRMGLIDFPGWMDGREVCLCWKHGEAELAWWHEIDAGFRGRQPLQVAAEMK
jgi:hypothetical protein